MKLHIFKPQLAPGFRLSLADIVIFAVCACARLLLMEVPYLEMISPMPLHLFATFFCFCNVFRIGTTQEAFWCAIFLTSCVFAFAFEISPYPMVLIITVPAAFAVIAWSALRGKYNGIGHASVATWRGDQGLIQH